MVKQSAALDLRFAALSDPTRRALLERLARGDALLGELAAPLPMSLPAVSKHMDVLERAGLVRCVREGRARRCFLEPRALAIVESWLQRTTREWDARIDRLARHLEEDD